MRKPGKRGIIVASLTCAFALGLAGAAMAITIVADNTLSYQANNYNMSQGEQPAFVNNDSPANPHNVTSRGKIGGRPLFRTPNLTGPGGSAPVKGTEYLTQGNYPFFCSVHPDMQATLHVSGAGTPVARPQIDVSVLSGRLARVRNSRKARVKVEATTLSKDVALTLKLGKTKLGSRSNIDLTAGQSRTLTLRLSRKAKQRLAGKTRAKVTLSGSVPFGKTDTASKLLK